MIQALKKLNITFHKDNEIKLYLYSKMEAPKVEPKAEPVPLRTPFNLHNVPVGTKGLVAGDIYKTEEGVLMIMPEK